MTREIGIEDARKILGELVDEAASGADVLLTRHRRPVARLTRAVEPHTFTVEIEVEGSDGRWRTVLTEQIDTSHEDWDVYAGPDAAQEIAEACYGNENYVPDGETAQVVVYAGTDTSAPPLAVYDGTDKGGSMQVITPVDITPEVRAERALAGARLVADHAPLMDRYGVGPGWDVVTGYVHIPQDLRVVQGLMTRQDDLLWHAQNAGYVRDGSNYLGQDWSTMRDSTWTLTVAGLRALRDAELCDRLAAAVRDHRDADNIAYHLAQIDSARP